MYALFSHASQPALTEVSIQNPGRDYVLSTQGEIWMMRRNSMSICR